MKAMLVVVVMVLLAPEALADGAAWQRKRIPVWDHAGVGWAPVVAEAVATINRQLPKRAPRLKHRPRATPCVRHRRGISVCEDGVLPFPGQALYRIEAAHTLTKATVLLRPFAEFTFPLELVCHELYHATTGLVSHGAWTTERPCPFDERAARRVYRKHGR